jgi:bla regulator protein blaR1
MKLPIVCAILAASALQHGYGQSEAVPTKFEVASIKRNAGNDKRRMFQVQPGGRLNATGFTVKMLIAQAYNVQEFQISGGPGWIASDPFDIVAKAEDGGPDRLSMEQLRPMLQALLEERFQLKIRREAKEMPVYSLVVGKNGPKLEASTSERGPMVRMGRGQLIGTKAPMSQLAGTLSRMVGRPIIDKTGLKGEYDFKLEWTPEPGQGDAPFEMKPKEALPPVDSNGPSLFTAIQEQLGLRLESQKAPGEVIVIDRVEKPSEN